MDKAVTMNKIEQLITMLNNAHTTSNLAEKQIGIDNAVNLAMQIRQQIRKA